MSAETREPEAPPTAAPVPVESPLELGATELGMAELATGSEPPSGGRAPEAVGRPNAAPSEPAWLLGDEPTPEKALAVLGTSSAGPAEKAQLLERLSRELGVRIGNWGVERLGTASDGSIVYVGAMVMRSDRPVLVIKTDGAILTGVLGQHVTFDAAGRVITCLWDLDGWKVWP